MRTLFITGALALLSFTSSTVGTSVYVCVSPNAKKYHFAKSCSGLQRCTHTIKQTTVESAKKDGYTVCLKE